MAERLKFGASALGSALSPRGDQQVRIDLTKGVLAAGRGAVRTANDKFATIDVDLQMA